MYLYIIHICISLYLYVDTHCIPLSLSMCCILLGSWIFPIESSWCWPQVSQRRIQGTSRPDAWCWLWGGDQESRFGGSWNRRMLQKSLGILEVFEAFWHVTFWQLKPRGLVLFMFLVLFGCVCSLQSTAAGRCKTRLDWRPGWRWKGCGTSKSRRKWMAAPSAWVTARF